MKKKRKTKKSRSKSRAISMRKEEFSVCRSLSFGIRKRLLKRDNLLECLNMTLKEAFEKTSQLTLQEMGKRNNLGSLARMYEKLMSKIRASTFCQLISFSRLQLRIRSKLKKKFSFRKFCRHNLKSCNNMKKSH